MLLRRARALLLAAAALAGGCSSTMPNGPIYVRTAGGTEQGVATQFGLVCLGKTARSGRCDVTVFYGDGPSSEPGQLTPIDANLCGIQIELRAPTCEVSYFYPSVDDELVIGLAGEREQVFYDTRLVREPGATHRPLVEMPSGFPTEPFMIGAPVYRHEDQRYRLVGLVTGVTSAGGKQALECLWPREMAPLAITAPHREPWRPSPTRDDIIR